MSADVLVLNFTTDPNVTGVTDVFRWIIEEAFISEGSGSGAVDSVNGQTGVVVLDAADVGALALTGGVVTGPLEVDVVDDGISFNAEDTGSGNQSSFSSTGNGQQFSALHGGDGSFVDVTPAQVRINSGAGAATTEIIVTPTSAKLNGVQIATVGDLTGLATTSALTAEATARATAVSGEATSRIVGDAASVGTAATDATTKANAAQAAAISAAATDATTKVAAEATARTTADALLTPKTRTLTASTGLTGGGDLSADRSFAVAVGEHLAVESGLLDPILTEQRQDAPRRGHHVYKNRALTALQRDGIIGDSIGSGAGGLYFSTDWATWLGKAENRALGLADVGGGAVMAFGHRSGTTPVTDPNGTTADATYGTSCFTDTTSATRVTDGVGVATAGKLTSNGTSFGDVRTSRRVITAYRKVTSGATFQISYDGGSTWTSDIATAGSGIAFQDSGDLGAVVTNRSIRYKQTSAGAGGVTIEEHTPLLTAGGAGVAPTCFGHGGLVTADLVNDRTWETYLTALVTAGTPMRRMFISIGGNNGFAAVTAGTPVATWTAAAATDLDTILTRGLAASPLTEFVYIFPYRSENTGAGKTAPSVADWKMFRSAMRTVCVTRGVAMIDLYRRLGTVSNTSDPWTVTMDSGLHLTPVDQQIIADVIVERQGVYRGGPSTLPRDGSLPMTGDIDLGGQALTDSSSTPFVRFKKFMRSLMPSGAVVIMDEANDGSANGPRLRGFKDTTAETGNLPTWAFGSFFGKGYFAPGDSTIGPNGYLIAVSTGVMKFLKPDLATRADLQAKSLDLDADAATSTTVPRLGQVVAKSMVTTKGDLIAASASATPVRVAVGNQRDRLISDSAATGGVSWEAAPIFKRKTATTSRNTTVTATGDPDLTTTGLAISTVYRFMAMLNHQGLAADDIKLQISMPTGCTIDSIVQFAPTNVAAAPWAINGRRVSVNVAPFAVGLIDGSTPTQTLWTGMVVMSTNTGTFEIQWSQNSSSATNVDLMAGSWMLLEKVA